MEYLPLSQALIVVGGRNDDLCKSLNIPFLNDIHLFLLDQKSWIQVKYLPTSHRICRIGNHSMTVITDGETTQKVIIFGGITDYNSSNLASLGNQLVVCESFQIMLGDRELAGL